MGPKAPPKNSVLSLTLKICTPVSDGFALGCQGLGLGLGVEDGVGKSYRGYE